VLAVWLLFPGLAMVAGVILRFLVNGQTAAIYTGLGLTIGGIMILAGILAYMKRYFLAIIYLGIDLAANGLSASGFDVGAGGSTDLTALLAGSVFAAMGILWVLIARRSGKDAGRALRVVSVLLILCFFLNLPIVASRMGEAIGVALTPPPMEWESEPGQRIPDMHFVDGDGSEVPLNEPGTVYVVNFWATWCGPCLMELPGLLELMSRLHDEPSLRFLAVNTEGFSRDDLEDFLDQHELTGLPVHTDPESFGELFGSSSIPLTVVVKDRVLLARHVGYSSQLVRDLEDEIRMASASDADQDAGLSSERPLP